MLDDEIPAAYSKPGYLGVKPGADWFVNGRRYREVNRWNDSDGRQRMCLRLIEEP